MKTLPSWTPLLGLAMWAALAGSLLVRLFAEFVPSLAGSRASGRLDEADLAELLVTFIPLVLVPLVLPLAVSSGRSQGTGSRLAAALPLLHLVGAIGVAIGALLPTGGTLSLALAGLWLAFTGLAALHGLRRLFVRRNLRLPELAIDLALLWLPGAAVWLLVYRGELVLGGFGGLAALLTAAHFHAAGFATLSMAGLLGRCLAGLSPGRLTTTIYRVVAALLMLAFPLLAAGIGGAVRPLELAGASLYALALPLLAALQIYAAIRLRDRSACRVLLVLSALAALFAVLFAARFAVQGFYGAAVPISTMLLYHAAVNVFGFLGLGLLAWSRLRPAPLTDSRP